MAESFNSIDGIQPGATVDTDLYTSPSGANAVDAIVTELQICNVGAATDKARVHKVPAAGAVGISNALLFDVDVPVGNPVSLDLKIALPPDYKLVVRSANGDLTFSGSVLERDNT